MTKYFIQNNKEWDYDELVKNEILLFSVPDDFEFSLELVEEYLDFIELLHERNSYGGINILKNNKKKTFLYNIYLYRLMEQNIGEKGKHKPIDFIKWLEQFGVKQLEYKLIED